jgi:predicted phosphodiesterase
MGRKKIKDKKVNRNKLLPRIIRSIIAVVLLSALILGITLLVKKISDVDLIDVPGPVGTLINNSLNKSKDSINQLVKVDNPVSSSSSNNKSTLFKACVISEIHQDTTNLSKALEKVTDNDCMLLFVVGDLTNYGDVNTLSSIKTILDNSGIKDYYVIPGDHDLAQSVSLDNFKNVFGYNYHFVEFADVRFLMLDNSANYTPISKELIAWMEENIKRADFVILSQPLYVDGLNPPFNSIYMGGTRNPPETPLLKEKQQIVKDQGIYILNLIRDTNNVKAVIAGEHHRSSVLEDPVRKVSDPLKSTLKHYVVGAVTSTVNDYPQNIIQSSRFSVINLYEDKSYSIEDISID